MRQDGARSRLHRKAASLWDFGGLHFGMRCHLKICANAVISNDTSADYMAGRCSLARRTAGLRTRLSAKL